MYNSSPCHTDLDRSQGLNTWTRLPLLLIWLSPTNQLVLPVPSVFFQFTSPHRIELNLFCSPTAFPALTESWGEKAWQMHNLSNFLPKHWPGRSHSWYVPPTIIATQHSSVSQEHSPRRLSLPPPPLLITYSLTESSPLMNSVFLSSPPLYHPS